MKIFNFFKKEIKNELSVKHRILILKENIPEFYNTQRQYKNFIEFLENNEYELCLESLLEICDETNHYFSTEYWNIIKEIANQIKKESIVKYCKNQIERNRIEINWKLPLGFTINKVDDNYYQTFTSKKNTANWNSNRRIIDKVLDLKSQNGIHNKSKGRNGYLYYVENGKIAEIEYELEVGGLAMFFRNTNNWFYPNEVELSLEEKEIIKAQIINWSKETKNAIVFD